MLWWSQIKGSRGTFKFIFKGFMSHSDINIKHQYYIWSFSLKYKNLKNNIHIFKVSDNQRTNLFCYVLWFYIVITKDFVLSSEDFMEPGTITGAKRQRCTGRTVFLPFLLFYHFLFILTLKSMAAHRTIRSKAVKFGTLSEGHAKRPWHKLDIDWPKGGTIANS